VRFNKLLHCEIVLDKRGPEHMRQVYKNALSQISFIPGVGFRGTPAIRSLPDHNVMDQLFILKKYVLERPPIYHVGRDFLQAMSGISNEIPVELLPKRFFAYLSFADHAIRDEEDWVEGAYVFIGSGLEAALRPQEHNDYVLWIHYTTKSQSLVRLCVELKHGRIDDLVAAAIKDDFTLGGAIPTDPKDTEARLPVWRAVINLVMYINSVDPDLVLTPPASTLKPAAKKAASVQNQCTLPITLVSWNYHAPHYHNVDKSFVNTFQRWQRVGPQLSQVKLIWVTEHARRYKNVRVRGISTGGSEAVSTDTSTGA
jgi:hypothetical protein